MSQDGDPNSTNLTHPKFGVSDKGYGPRKSVALVRVQFSARDLDHLSDCDDLIQQLCERAAFVELSFTFDDLEWIREALAPERTGWGPDVEVREDALANDRLIRCSHRRGL